MTIDQFYKNMHPILIGKDLRNNLINRLKKFDYLTGYKKLKKYI